jgi:hypothetical protein
MFIARHCLNNARSIGAQCGHQLHFAPNGANHFVWWPGYKHVAPPEQRPGQLRMFLPFYQRVAGETRMIDYW